MLKIILIFSFYSSLALSQDFPDSSAPPKEFNNYQGHSTMQRMNMTVDKINEMLAQIKALRADVDVLKEKVNSLSSASAAAPAPTKTP